MIIDRSSTFRKPAEFDTVARDAEFCVAHTTASLHSARPWVIHDHGRISDLGSTITRVVRPALGHRLMPSDRREHSQLQTPIY